MSTVTVFGLLVALAFVAGGCFGYAATSLIDSIFKEKKSQGVLY